MTGGFGGEWNERIKSTDNFSEEKGRKESTQRLTDRHTLKSNVSAFFLFFFFVLSFLLSFLFLLSVCLIIYIISSFGEEKIK